MNPCHACGKPITSGDHLYHSACSTKLFGRRAVPALHFSMDDLNQLAEKIVRHSVTVPGVQPKLSLHLERGDGPGGARLTIVGLEGAFILKPPSSHYPDMPQLEHYTMQIAASTGLEVASCGLIPLADGALAYVTRRMDRTTTGKLHMEDMCQLTDKLTEQKYRGSMEQVGKAVRRFSSNSGFDTVRLFELTLFCFATGNADMHLKNFSLLHETDGMIRLAPAYDLLPTKLLIPEDREEIALPLNGKKNRIRRADFDAFGKSLRLTERQMVNAYARLQRNLMKAIAETPAPFVTIEHQNQFNELVGQRLKRLQA